MAKVSATSPICIDVVSSMDKLSIIENKSLNIDGREDLQDGFLLCDLGAVLSNYHRWVKMFPRITPFYAVKCNPDITLLKILIALGIGFDCASKKEIQQLLELGAHPDRIIYANPCKQASHVRYSRDNDVRLVVVDSEEELVKIKENFPEAELVLRIQTNDFQCWFPLDSKFGANLDLSRHLIDTAHKMGLKMSGISFHVGCQCLESNAFLDALQNCKLLFEYAQEVGYKFNILDIGGGYFGSDDTTVIFEEFASIVSQHVDKIFPAESFDHVRIIAEPGRYLSESAFTLATSIIAKKKVTRIVPVKNKTNNDAVDHDPPTSTKEPAFMYYISDGTYGTLSKARFEPVTPDILKFDTEPSCYLDQPVPEKATKFSSTIWGPTCDSLDRVMKDVMLPELDTSNWLLWHNIGAYYMTISCFFNGFNTTTIYYVISKDDFDRLLALTGGKDIPGLKFERKSPAN